jgi:hypothetical protein
MDDIHGDPTRPGETTIQEDSIFPPTGQFDWVGFDDGTKRQCDLESLRGTNKVSREAWSQDTLGRNGHSRDAIRSDIVIGRTCKGVMPEV